MGFIDWSYANGRHEKDGRDCMVSREYGEKIIPENCPWPYRVVLSLEGGLVCLARPEKASKRLVCRECPVISLREEVLPIDTFDLAVRNMLAYAASLNGVKLDEKIAEVRKLRRQDFDSEEGAFLSRFERILDDRRCQLTGTLVYHPWFYNHDTKCEGYRNSRSCWPRAIGDCPPTWFDTCTTRLEKSPDLSKPCKLQVQLYRH